MREAVRRIRALHYGGGDEEDVDDETFLESLRPSGSEDRYALGTDAAAILVNSVYGTACSGATDIFGSPGVSYLAIQQRLLGVLNPMAMASSGYVFRIKFRPPERATHRFNPADTSLQTVGVATDRAGRLTSILTAQLVAVALGLPHFMAQPSVCHNRVFTTFLPYELQLPAFEAANPHLVEQPYTQQCTVALAPPAARAENVKLLVFPSGVIICVGAKTTDEMTRTMEHAIPLLANARVLTAGAHAKRKRSASTEQHERRKRPRIQQ